MTRLQGADRTAGLKLLSKTGNSGRAAGGLLRGTFVVIPLMTVSQPGVQVRRLNSSGRKEVSTLDSRAANAVSI